MAESKLVVITPIEGASIDNSLPGDDSGRRWPRPDGNPPYPDQGLPDGGNVGTGERPVQLPAAPPPYPSVGLPPSVWPGVPVHKPAPGEPPIALPPGSVYPPLPEVIGNENVLALVWIPKVGYRWVVLGPVVTSGMLQPPTATPTRTRNP